jgi:hypothetical protein
VSTSGAAFAAAERPLDLGRVLVACVATGAVWVVCEVAGGLAFLAAGIRLWRYEIAPLWFEITSPVVWLLAAAGILPLTIAFERRWTRGLRGARRFARLAVFVAIVGPVIEVLLNEWFFKPIVGRPLYAYLVAPTFDGSGSLFSPLYYLTLLVHVPITDRILKARRLT